MEEMNTSRYLSQFYEDAWEDYQRSIRSSSFPVWDYVILTASNEQQAKAFEMQLESRKSFLPSRTCFSVIPDEGNLRIGSGGATFSVLKYLRERESGFEGKRVLVIHSGGDSKRVPQYSALGKLFSPVPHELPDGRCSTPFDEFIITMSAVPGRIRDGMLLLSGDVLLLFNPLLIDYSGHGAAMISFKEKVETGKDHGVYLRGDGGNLKAFYHKKSVDFLRSVGAVNANGDVDIDTGAIVLGVDILNSLFSLISTMGQLDEVKYQTFVNNKVRLSLYGDLQFPLAEDSTLEQFYKEKPEGDYSEELMACRRAIWDVLRPYSAKLLRLAPAKFLHFGTTREILALMNDEIDEYKELGWSRRIKCSQSSGAGYNSNVALGAVIGDGCYLEVSNVHSGAYVEEGCVLSYVDVAAGSRIPPHVVLHGLKQNNGKFVCRIFATTDDPKGNSLFGRELAGEFWDNGDAHTLWTANLYPECDTIHEAVDWAIQIYDMARDQIWTDEWKKTTRKSLGSGFNDADTRAILAWHNKLADLVQMNNIAQRIHEGKPAKGGRLPATLSKVQAEWLDRQLCRARFSEKIRLHYYTGLALGGIDGEREIEKAFSCISSAILQQSIVHIEERKDIKIHYDHHSVSMPLRVNWGGGWSDTPPYCNENGGTVLNAAILLNGERPIRVKMKRLNERKIIFESRDMSVYGEFDKIEPLQSVGDPFDSFVLQKAALLVCGVIPQKGGDLQAILDRLGGGFWMNTEVVGVPKGSGLGTSSILAAACAKALCEFFAIEYTEDDLYSYVLCMEQMMSTGGGWQDQVGGITNGIKFIRSRPGLKQSINVEHLKLDEEVLKELNDRFALVYTGQRRLARNLLRDVVGRYIGNEPKALYALNEIQRKAALMKFELERGNVDGFAELLTEHWELSKMIDAGSTNTLIDQIFDCMDDLIAGRMICGAGGGGFLQVVMKKGIGKEQLQKRLSEVFSDTDITVWQCKLVV